MKRLVCLCLLPLMLTGCGSEGFADRTYTRAIGLHGALQMCVQGFEQEGCTVTDAGSIGEALQFEEAAAGGRIFTGHTELLCVDGSGVGDAVEALFLEQGISPGCKVLYTRPVAYLQQHDAAETVHSLRMAERSGLLPRTELATVLEEWLGVGQTALVPVEGCRKLVLLRQDGKTTALSEQACEGMRYLRHAPAVTNVTLDDGTEIGIDRIRLRKTAEDGTVRFTVKLRVRNASPSQCSALHEKLRQACEMAVREMHTARADVIGVQEICESHGIPADPLPEVQVRVEVQQ
ncbi:MAG: hypothetical protein IKN55_12345 [Oscillospiraceae bacterium]|nr:hypothetical protein [Oscillospiraceae bacterium]